MDPNQKTADEIIRSTDRIIPDNERAEEWLAPTTSSPSFERVRVTIIEGAWKGEKGWITGPKNEVDANPITTDGGICLCWFDSEIRRENSNSTRQTAE